jgi:hypothetical protein
VEAKAVTLLEDGKKEKAKAFEKGLSLNECWQAELPNERQGLHTPY